MGLVNSGSVTVTHAESSSTLYIKAEVCSGTCHAHAVICDDYTRIIEVGKDGEISYSQSSALMKGTREALKDYPLEELFSAIETMTVEELSFLKDAA